MPASPSLRPVRTSSSQDPAIPSALKQTSSLPSPSPKRPPLIDPNSEGGRRTSVQFVPTLKHDLIRGQAGSSRSSSAQPNGSRTKISGLSAAEQSRRFSSPPPPAPFRPSVSFDTFNNKEASNYSLTLNRKHRAYEYTKRSRTFLCGTDTNEYSDTALEWLVDELVDDGDEVVCLRVVEKDSREAVKWAGGMGEKGYRREAERMIEAIERKNTENRAISLVLEFSVGKVHDTIQQMIRIYEPALLVVGTRGRSLTGYQGLLSSGSVSKYCLQYSPVPVIVVRPSSKREAKKHKRLRDPSRTGYRDILDKSEDAPRGRGGHLLDLHNRSSLTGADFGALGEIDSAHDPDQEARMVAEAIGYTPGPQRPDSSSRDRRESSLSRVASGQSEASDPRSAGSDRQIRSPDTGNLDTPEVSDEEDLYDADATPILRPEDEALALAYERAQKIMEEEQEENEARSQRQRERSERAAGGSRPGSRAQSRARDGGGEEGRGAAALGLLAQLDRGLK